MNRLAVYCVWVFVILSPTLTTGQQENPDNQPKTDLSFSMSLQLGTSGAQFKSGFSLMDDLGFHYDVMSLLKDQSVRNEIELTEAQLQRMKKFKAELDSELTPLAVKGSRSSEMAAALEARVKAAEAELFQELSPTQLLRLEQVKTQLRIEQSGIAKLATSRFLTTDLGLSDTEASAIRDAIGQRQSKFRKQLHRLYSDANQKVLREFKSSNQKKINKAFSTEHLDWVCTQPLFTRKPRSKFRATPTGVYLMELLRDSEVGKKLEITTAQQAKVGKLKLKYESRLREQLDELLAGDGKALTIAQRGRHLQKLNRENRRNFGRDIQSILLEHQYRSLFEFASRKEVSQLGTVACLCQGVAATQLGFQDSEVERVYLSAVKIHRELEPKVRQLRSKFESDIYRLLPRFDVAERLGEPLGKLRR